MWFICSLVLKIDVLGGVFCWLFFCDHPESPYPFYKKGPPVSLTRCFLHIPTFLHSVKMFDASARKAVSGSQIILCTLFSFREFWFVGLDLFWVVFFFFFSAYVTWPLLFLLILSYKCGDSQSTSFEKKVVWMFVRDLLLTKQIDITEIVSGWKSLCYMSPLSVQTVRNFSEHSWQINWSRNMYF